MGLKAGNTLVRIGVFFILITLFCASVLMQPVGAMGSKTPNPPVNPATFRFRVEIEGRVAAYASEVSGLSQVTEKEYPFDDTGGKEFITYARKRTPQQPIVLKRGMAGADLWKWYNDVRSGTFLRKDGVIILMDLSGKDLLRWNFIMAYPVKWAGSDYQGERIAVVFESIELAHHGVMHS